MFTSREAAAIRAYRASKRTSVCYSWVAPCVAVCGFALIELCRGFLTGGWPIVFTERVCASGYGLIF